MTTLYLAWQHAPSRRWFPVGRLIRRRTATEEFEFSYVQGARDAQDVAGFRGIPEFPDLDRRYEATELFPTFRNRAMNKRRRDRAAHLHELGLDVDECDEVAELLASGGRSHTDSDTLATDPAVGRGTGRPIGMKSGSSTDFGDDVGATIRT